MGYIPESLIEFIVFFKLHGSSLIMNWGEDTGAWEVSLIYHGNRFTGFHADLLSAMIAVFKDAFE